ncbi:hypothetical protein KFF05_09500 [bacterium SCSIO 12827]|nr:hypothetical protein KFF05_09500 [bacterium SCSIO 12827]
MTNFHIPYDPDPNINLTQNCSAQFSGRCLLASANIFERLATATPPSTARDMAQGKTGLVICGFSGDSPRLL